MKKAAASTALATGTNRLFIGAILAICASVLELLPVISIVGSILAFVAFIIIWTGYSQIKNNATNANAQSGGAKLSKSALLSLIAILVALVELIVFPITALVLFSFGTIVLSIVIPAVSLLKIVKDDKKNLIVNAAMPFVLDGYLFWSIFFALLFVLLEYFCIFSGFAATVIFLILQLLAAVVAGQCGSPAFHFALGAAVGAFIQDPAQAVRPEGIVNFHTVFLLPFEMVKAEGGIQSVGQFLDGLLLDLFPGVQQCGLCGDLDTLADLQLVVQGISGECAEGFDHHHGYIQLL